MKTFFTLFNKYVLENLPKLTFITLTVVFLINAFYNIALLGDGTWDFINILNNIFWDNENRNYATFIVNLPMILAIKLGCKDFNLFILLQGFWFFFVTLICLFIAYINIPAKNKNYFHFILLSYLISMNFVGTYFSNKSFLCAGLFWIIAIIFIFENFNTISFKKLMLLLICSFAMIKNYQWSAIFIFLLLIYWFIKIKEIDYTNIETIKIFKFFLLIVLFIIFILTILWVYNSYYYYASFLFNPIIEFYTDSNFIIFSITLLSILFIVMKPFIKVNNLLFKLLLYLSFIFIPYSMLKNNFLYFIGNFRLLNFIMPLLLSSIIFYIYKKKIVMNFTTIKILNLLLLIIFIINISVIAKIWNYELNDFYKLISKTQGIISSANTKTLRLQEGDHLNPWLSIILQKQRGQSHIKSVIYIEDKQNRVFHLTFFNIALFVETMPNLKKFEISYDNELLKKIAEKNTN
ncbi:MAG: hypothetical protein PHI20_00740 [Endomicrobiaceae bacterium]|jgi:hypothetical protein|nr:hypothetical protein [Endomicrobiaceae bacterium]MDD3729544.1 hypothetical protein [Endomicrobiaceae bacterium]MDD4165493.1 hypothetical protein [Endomicrobiaceae bacterium]